MHGGVTNMPRESRRGGREREEGEMCENESILGGEGRQCGGAKSRSSSSAWRAGCWPVGGGRCGGGVEEP